MPQHFVVTGPGQRKCGIVASSYKELLQKCRTKFGFKIHEEIVTTLDDNTEIDEEYFEFLSDKTQLHVSETKQDQTIDQIDQLAAFLHACLQHQPQIHNKVMACLQDPVNCNQAVTILELMTKVAHTSVPLSSRDKDNEWFKGLDTRFKTKEAVLRNSAETRMRGYLYHTRKELLSENLLPDSPQNKAISYFKSELEKCRYNGSYFDRLAPLGERLCDAQGLFECEGPYDQHRCSGVHFINPYGSREARIIFSTWNLDHIIEKSRRVIPSLKSALSGSSSSCVNLSYFYSLLFLHKSVTPNSLNGNLKLVHIACHVKKPHEFQCTPEKIYVNQDHSESHDNVDGQLSRRNRMKSRGVKRSLPVSDYYTRSKKVHKHFKSGGCPMK